MTVAPAGGGEEGRNRVAGGEERRKKEETAAGGGEEGKNVVWKKEDGRNVPISLGGSSFFAPPPYMTAPASEVLRICVTCRTP
jgi:hypothetical protein